jgi:hypothetical protein
VKKWPRCWLVVPGAGINLRGAVVCLVNCAHSL